MTGDPTHFAPVLYVHRPAQGMDSARVLEFYIRDMYLVTLREAEMYGTRDEAYEAARNAAEHHTGLLTSPGRVQPAIKPIWMEV